MSDEGTPSDVMRMVDGFAHWHHRREARIAVLQQLAPVSLRLALKNPLQARTHAGPARRVPMIGIIAHRDSQLVEQHGEELNLERSDANPFVVGATIGVVEGRAAVEQIRMSLLSPIATR